jgi:hypothetical protein
VVCFNATTLWHFDAESGRRPQHQSLHFDHTPVTSGLPSLADILSASRHVSKVPCVDGSGLAREIFTSQAWSVLPCVRPVDAVHMTAGHNALRGSGPGQKLAFDDAMAQVGCPDRRIDRLCITCCSPPNLYITPVVRRDLVYRASATGSLYRSPLAIMAQAIRAILLASAMAATLVGRRPNNAVSQGRCLVPWILA